MSYQVLARKWRPQRFDDVIGQRGVTQTLRNAIAAGRIAQSFVFAGPRGGSPAPGCVHCRWQTEDHGLIRRYLLGG